MKLLIMSLVGILIAGCAGNGDLLKRAETGDRENVCEIVSPETPPEPGYADLTIRGSLKSHGTLSLPIGRDLHGTSEYRLVVNVDGERLRLCGERRPDEGTRLPGRHPEAGTGIRYLFKTHLRLKTGMHRIIVALPEDGVATEREVILEEGTDNVLDIIPSYYADRRQREPGSAGATSFREGVSGLELVVHGKEP